MKGEDLQKLLASMGYSNVSELARILGYANMQNLHSMFRAQDVRTGLIEELSEKLHRPVGDFFPNSKNITATNSIVVGDNATNRNSFNGSKFLVEEQAKQITMLVEELTKSGHRVDTLLNIIEK